MCPYSQIRSLHHHPKDMGNSTPFQEFSLSFLSAINGTKFHFLWKPIKFSAGVWFLTTLLCTSFFPFCFPNPPHVLKVNELRFCPIHLGTRLSLTRKGWNKGEDLRQHFYLHIYLSLRSSIKCDALHCWWRWTIMWGCTTLNKPSKQLKYLQRKHKIL